MGSFGYTNFAIKTPDSNNENTIKQLINCIIKRDSYSDSTKRTIECDKWNRKDDCVTKCTTSDNESRSTVDCDFLGSFPDPYGYGMIIDGIELFDLVNYVFGKSYLACDFCGGNNTVDWYKTDSYLYEPDKMKVYWKINEYCYGAGTGVGPAYCQWKDEIEAVARKRNIEIEWSYLKSVEEFYRGDDFEEQVDYDDEYDEDDEDDPMRQRDGSNETTGRFYVLPAVYSLFLLSFKIRSIILFETPVNLFN